MDMTRKICLLLLCFALVCGGARAAILTPYPTEIALKQINSAEKERVRLAQGHKKYDRQPTGFYVDSGKSVVVSVEVVTPAADGSSPVLTIGTLGFNVGSRNVGGTAYEEHALKEGKNTLAAKRSGLIYLSYVTNKSASPVGEVKALFDSEASQHVRAPRYVHGVTTQAEFEAMLDTFPTPDVIYHSDYVVVVATRENAKLHKADRDKWMQDLHTLLEKEDEISGMDNADPKPVHHRLKAGEVRFLLTNNTSASPHASSAGYTGYPDASIHRYLTPFGGNNNSWMLGHELGHQHQQPAYMINQSSESTVNIYSYVVERNIQGSSYNRTSAVRWKQAQDTYLKLPVEKRVYDMNSDSLQSLTGFNRDELRFMVWEQLFLILGDNFYKRLHRVTREEQVVSGSEQDRRLYLIWKASQVSGYDLREFFNQWGIRVTDEAYRATLSSSFKLATDSGYIVPLPRPVAELMAVTGASRPAWAPLPLRGIASSWPAVGDERLDRSGWVVTTSFEGVPDNVIQGTLPDNIIDDNPQTAFSFIKPGKTYEGVTGPNDYIPSFTIDMQTPQEFDCFLYKHRAYSNTEPRIRASGASFYGKNDENSAFELILDSVALDVAKEEVRVELPQTVYCRFIKVAITDWNKDAGNTIQVAEFNVGKKQSAESSSAYPPLVIEEPENPVNPEEPEDSGEPEEPEAPENPGDPETSTGIAGQPNGATTLVYPNPVKAGQEAYLRLGDILGKRAAVVSLYSVAGQKILEQQVTQPLAPITIPFAGMFIITVQKDAIKESIKVVAK
jgi:hypothetical protein